MRTGTNVRRRKDGSYEARYIKERDENGKAVYGSVYGKTYEEAEEKREQKLEDLLISNNKPAGMKLLILGAGSHGQEVHEIAEALHVFSSVDFLDDNPSSDEVIGKWDDIESLRDEGYQSAIVAVGNEKLRKLWTAKLVSLGYEIPTLVHPTALISQNAKIEPGTVICARSTISSGVTIGVGCIISSGVTVGRSARVEPWTHIAEGGVIVQHNS